MIKVSARTVAVLAAFTLGISIIATPAQSAPKLKEVRVALSSFQDVCSIYVGIENGFYKQAGIKLNVKRTDWPGANELGVGGQVDMWTTSEADVIQQNNSGSDTTLAFPLFYFGGGGLMYDPKKFQWKTYENTVKKGSKIEDDIKPYCHKLLAKKLVSHLAEESTQLLPPSFLRQE